MAGRGRSLMFAAGVAVPDDTVAEGRSVLLLKLLSFRAKIRNEVMPQNHQLQIDGRFVDLSFLSLLLL